MRRWVSIVLFIAVLGVGVAAQPPQTITIDTATAGSEISPLVFGANFGPLNVVTVDLRDEAVASGITYLRFPGGRVGDLGDIPTFQIDLFFIVCDLMNCTPAISTRMEGGTPEKAAEMVRYVNVTKGYGVKYWSIGNETNLFDDYTAEQAAAEWRAIAEAMLEVDPDITFVGPDTSQFTGIEGDGNQRAHEFLREFLRVNGDMVDIVSVHRYPFGSTAATYDQLRADAETWEGLIDNLHRIAAEELGREVPVAITEVNSHWSSIIGQEATPDSFAAALWLADVFGQMLEGDLEIAAYFSLQTSDRLGGHGLLGGYDVRPTYYVYTLYKQFGTRMVSTETDGAVRAYAALRDDGALTVMLVNWNDTDASVTLDVPGFDFAESEAEITDFTETEGVLTTVQTPGDSLEQTLPPRSMRLIIIPARPS